MVKFPVIGAAQESARQKRRGLIVRKGGHADDLPAVRP